METTQMKFDESNDICKDYGFYKIGLDIGIASVGWACLACDSKGEVKHILDLGVRTFDIPENPKDGSSLTAPRRESRGLRRRLRRKRLRLDTARNLLGIGVNDLNDNSTNVYELRYRALDEKIGEKEFARVLMLILKHRGFQSNRRGESKKEDGDLKKAISKNKSLMAEKGYRTVGELIYKEFSKTENGKLIINSRNHNDYEKCFSRKILKKELEILFTVQRQYGNKLASEDIEEKFTKIFVAQRSFDDGPGKGSNYSAEYKVGKCPFNPEEKRIAKATYTFEYFRMLQTLNHLRISEDGSERTLTQEERKKIKEYCLYKDKVKYSDIRKILKLGGNAVFSGLTYKGVAKPKKEKAKVKSTQIDMFSAAESVVYEEKAKNVIDIDILKATEDKTIFCKMANSKKIRDCLSEGNKDNTDLIDGLAEILSRYKSEEKIKENIAKSGYNEILTDDEIDKLINVNVSEFGHLGKTAISKIIPYLEEGFVYSEAMQKAGYNHSALGGELKRSKLIDVNEESLKEELADITSPAVKRAVSQTVKVLNAIIRKYGSPVAINVELARELAKTFDERKDIEKENKERFENNEKKIAEIREKFGIAVPTGQDLVKYLLYEEQGGKCLYSGKDLDLKRVMTDRNYAQVDHIIPYSRSFCDAKYNKVLVLSEENQKKGNKTPREYLDAEEKWDNFCALINALPTLGKRKKETLLREKYSKENSKEWKERSLNDTKYISRFVYNMLRNRLMFADCDMGEKRVTAVNGVVTSYARKLWGIQKVREDGDLHHVVDAVVIGCVGDGFIQKLTKWSRRKECKFVASEIIDYETGEVIKREELMGYPDAFPMPHNEFRRELEMRLSENPTFESSDELYFKYGYDSDEIKLVKKVFVSRAPERKAKGAIHKDTVYSKDAKGNTTLKRPLTDLKLDENGEIKDYNELARQNDRLLYEALKKRLIEFGGDGKKAFAEEFHKPKADGTDGPIVKKVLLNQNTDAHVKLNRGMASNDGMVRVDIFEKDGKFYGVPVYVADIYAGILPNKAATANKREDEWREMTDEYEFKFSLYKNDLVYIESENGLDFYPTNKNKQKNNYKQLYAYYQGFNRTNAAMDFIVPDNSYKAESKGIKKLKCLKKYEVDVLGNVHEIKKEKRPPAHMKP